MRNKTLVSVVALCASTAAVAHVSTGPVLQDAPVVQNAPTTQDVPNSTSDDMTVYDPVTNDTTTDDTMTDPMVPETATPDSMTTDPTLDPATPIEPAEPDLDDNMTEPMDDTPPTR